MKNHLIRAKALAIAGMLCGALLTPASAAVVGHWTFEMGEELLDRTRNFPDLSLQGDAAVAEGKLDLNGMGTEAFGWAVTDSLTGAYTGPTITNKTLMAWVILQGLGDIASAGSIITLDAVNSDTFDGVVFGEREPNRWMSGSSGFARTQDLVPGFEEVEIEQLLCLAITYEHLGGGQLKVTAYRNGEPFGEYQIGNAAQWNPSDAEVHFGHRHGSVTAGPGALDALLEEARIYDTALTAEEVLSVYQAGPVVVVDADSDGLRDDWEMQYFGNLGQTAAGDPDGDGITNLDELKKGTDPTKKDTDGDGLPDGAETKTGTYVNANDTGTDPLKPDSDNDGLSDSVETNTGAFVGPNNTGTNPNLADSDGDRRKDGDEVTAGTDPNNPKDPPTTLRDLLVGHWTFEAGSELVDQTGNFPDLVLKGNATVTGGQLDVNGSGTTAAGWAVTAGAYKGPAITSKTLIAWVTLQGLESVAKAGSAITLDRVNSDTFDGIIFAERLPNRWMNGSSGWSRTQDFNPGVEETQVGVLTQMAITYEHLAADKIRITGYRNGVLIGQYETSTPSRWEPGDAEVLFGVRHGSVNSGPGALDALISEASIYGAALTSEQIGLLYNLGPEDDSPLVGHWTFEPGQELADQTGNFPNLLLKGNGKVANGHLEVTGSGTSSTGWAVTDSGTDSYRGPQIADKTLIAWAKLLTLEDGARAGSLLTLDHITSDQFDGLVFAERQPNRWMNGSSFFQRTVDLDPGFEETAPGELINLAITYRHTEDGGIEITAYRNAEPIGQYPAGTPSSWETGDAEVFFGLRHGTTSGGPGGLNARIDEARIYAGALSPERITEIYRKGPIAGEDRDADGLPDVWEVKYFGNTDPTATGDPDADGSSNLDEYKRDTNPANPDTDADGLKDGAETKTGLYVSATNTGTDPLNPDTDNDGLKDGVETNTGVFVSATNTGTHPLKRDSDGDGLEDGAEVTAGTNPTNPLSPTPEPIEPYLIGHWTFEPGKELVDLAGNFPDLSLQGDALVAEGKLDVNGIGTEASGWAATDSDTGAYDGPTITDKSLVVWATLQGLSEVANAGSLMTLDRVNTDVFDGIIYGELEANHWMNGSSGWSRTQGFNPGYEETEVGLPIQVVITYKHLGGGQVLIAGYRNGEPIGQYQSANAAQWDPGDAEVHFGHRHGTVTGGPGAVDALVEEARLYGKALSPYQVKELFSPRLSLTVSLAGNKIRITWTDATATLQSTDTVTGGWATVPGAASPFEQDVSAAAKRFFRLTKPQ